MSTSTRRRDRGEVQDDVDELYPSAAREATPTAIAVYATLERNADPLSYGELSEATGISTRAVKSAIYTLRDEGLVVSTPDPRSPSRDVHRLVAV